MEKPSLLILSYSRLFRDARLLKQIKLFKDGYNVTTCGYGPQPVEGVEHIEIPMDQGMWNLNGRLITARLYSRVYWSLDGVRWVWNTLKGRKFDVVIANDFNTVPIAARLKPRGGFHADLHEYAPSEGEANPAWKRRIKPWREWVLRRYATKAGSSTTVCQGLADKFDEEFGFLPGLVKNAAPYAELQPTPPHSPLRLVHHGNASRERGLTWMVQAVMDSTADVTFDLYLPGPVKDVKKELVELSAQDPRITVHDAVPYSELIATLNDYDLGVYVLRPLTFNLEHALPNKIFDFIQARLGIITGPSPEMARLVRENKVGEVLHDFEARSLTDAINALTPEKVRVWKENANAAAHALSAEEQNEGWSVPIAELAARAGY